MTSEEKLAQAFDERSAKFAAMRRTAATLQKQLDELIVMDPQPATSGDELVKQTFRMCAAVIAMLGYKNFEDYRVEVADA